MKLVCDIEADSLLPKVSKFHCAGAIDVDTGAEYWFRPHQFKEYLELLDKAEIIIFHNANGYDIPALEKLSGYTWKPKAHVRCTKVMSQVLKFNRFGFGHALRQWGEFFNDHKGDYQGGFEEFNEDMFDYMKQDVRLTVKVYKYLMNELMSFIKKHKNKAVAGAITSETVMDYIMAEQSENGWQFNKEGAEKLLTVVDEKMKEISDFINPKLPAKVTVVDPDTTIDHEPITGKRYAKAKKPTYTKAGKLNSHLCRWFGVPLDTTVDTSPFFEQSDGFCRIDFTAGDIGNTDTVKTFLYSIGWEPDEWNYKRNEMGEFVKVSPKLSDSSLMPLGDVGQALMEFYTLRSRKSIVEGWFEYIDKQGRLHGDVFNIGTPTYRQTHKIIANLPSGKATLGREIRELFVVPEGKVLVSADSAACQLRLLAHYMKDPDFTKEVLEGDIHQKNADILSSASGIAISRALAKPFIFAFLYGAGGAKLARILGLKESTGNALKAQFQKAYPKLDRLIQYVQNVVAEQGYIIGLDGRPIYCDTKHKALNYLIQGAEAVVMKETVALIHSTLNLKGIDAKILLFYHDEVTYEVAEEQAEEAKEIIMWAFEEAPKRLGVDIMTCGDCKIGVDYYDVH